MKKILLILVFIPLFSFGQNSGCIDDIACNYDATATVDDGSCFYLSNPVIDITQQTWAVGSNNDCVGYPNYFQLGGLGDSIVFNTSGTGIMYGAAGNALDSLFSWSLCGSILRIQATNFWGYSFITQMSYDNGVFTDFGCYLLTNLANIGCLDSVYCNGCSIPGVYPDCNPPSTATTPTISNVTITQQPYCPGDLGTMMIEVTQTSPSTVYKPIIGFYMGSYFVSYASLSQTTAITLSLSAFNANVDYVVRLVDSTAYCNGNGGSQSGTSTVGIYDEYGPVTFTNQSSLSMQGSSTDLVCPGSCDGTINTSAFGGIPPYTFTLNGTSYLDYWWF